MIFEVETLSETINLIKYLAEKSATILKKPKNISPPQKRAHQLYLTAFPWDLPLTHLFHSLLSRRDAAK